jgi:hypothetical protein
VWPACTGEAEPPKITQKRFSPNEATPDSQLMQTPTPGSEPASSPTARLRPDRADLSADPSSCLCACRHPCPAARCRHPPARARDWPAYSHRARPDRQPPHSPAVEIPCCWRTRNWAPTARSRRSTATKRPSIEHHLHATSERAARPSRDAAASSSASVNGPSSDSHASRAVAHDHVHSSRASAFGGADAYT